MIAYVTAKASAQAAAKTLFYVQAADVADKACTREHYAEMLQVASLNATKKLPGLVCFHIGTKVRLTTSILPPWAVQDTTATVIDVEFSEKLPQQLGPEHALTRMPTAIYAQLEGLQTEFLPPAPCPQHTRYSAMCHGCKSFPGILQLKPKTDVWPFVAQDGHKANVKRTAFAMRLALACSLYTLQSTTCTPGLIAHFSWPARASADVKFLIAYVLLSRVRALSELISVNLTDEVREIIEQGPPKNLLEAFEALFGAKAEQTRAEAAAAAKHLNWT